MNYGRYEAKEELGRGAMSIVYKAWDPFINRWAAVKVLHTKFQKNAKLQHEINKQIILEAKMAGRLTHPNIVTVYDAGEEKGLSYIVMEFINGRHLRDIIDERGRLPAAEALSLGLQVANAIDYAHRHGVIHRDIKPSNIMIDAENLVKVMDFGIANVSEAGESGEVKFLGTPNYMAPEQVAEKKADHRADLYSIGVVLFQLLTGDWPFDGENLDELFDNIVHAKPKSPRAILPELPPSLNDLVLKAIAKDPDDRFQSAREMANELERSFSKLPEAPSASGERGAELSGEDFLAAKAVIQEVAERLKKRDLEGAAHLLLECREDIGEELIHLAARDLEQMKVLASVFVRAKDFRRAAKVYEDLGAYNMAISLYKVAHDFAAAADLNLRVGEDLEAARMFELAGKFKDAAEIYLRREQSAAAGQNFARLGDFLRAGECFARAGQTKLAVQILQKVPPSDVRYFEALELLGRILREHNYGKLAEQLLSSALAELPLTIKAIGSFYELAGLKLAYGNREEARGLFAKIQAFFPDYKETRKLLEQSSTAPPGEGERAETERPDDSRIISVLPGIGVLRDTPFFASLTQEEIKTLYQICRQLEVDEDEVIIYQGKPGPGLFIIQSGRARVEILRGEETKAIAELGVGNHIGEMSLLDATPTSAQVSAAEPCHLMFIPREQFQELLETEIQLAAKLHRVFLTELCARLRQTSEELARSKGAKS